MSQPEPPQEPDVFNDTRHLFHELRGRLMVISNAVDLIRADRSHPLSARQEAWLDQILKTTIELAETLTSTGTRMLDTLALAPSGTRLIWRVPCRQGERILARAINRTLTEMRAAYPLHQFQTAIIVAAPGQLSALRHLFAAKGWQTRLATSPGDVPFLLDQQNAELIALAPPAGSETEWWRRLRILLQSYRDQPILMHLEEAPPSPNKQGDGAGK